MQSVEAGIIKEVFEDAINYSKSGTLLRQVINVINSNFDFNKSKERHILNDVYEDILSNLSNSKATGEFYTPKALTNFIVEMIDPRLGQKVLDPACGTGGFLISAIEHLLKQKPSSEQMDQMGELINGKELKQMPHLLCMTNMILHGIDKPVGIKRGSSLSKPINDIKGSEKVDVIVANPPFGGVVKQGEEQNFPPALRSKETADLFLILMMNLLKPAGRVGLVLPDGILFGDGSQAKLKKELLENFNVHTIVKIPSGAFIYTPISTNLIFFEKGKPTKEVWYYQIQPPVGSKSYGKTKPISDKYFEECKQWWNNRTENEVAWKVDIKTIVEKNYNLDFKNPHVSQQEEELSYQEIVDRIKANLEESLKLI
jgi:type I restriction enzyme M protein